MKVRVDEVQVGDRTQLGEVIEVRVDADSAARTLVIDRRSHHQVGDLAEIVTLPDTRLRCPVPHRMIEVHR